MTEKIQKVPFGLNELLRIQQQGTPPDQLADSYVATIDSLDFFAALNLTGQQAQTAALGARNDNVTMVVPGGEVWRLLAANVQFGTFSLVGATIRASVQVIPLNGAQGANAIAVTLGTLGFDTVGGVGIVNTADSVDMPAVLPVPLVLLPGTTLRVILNQSSAAGTYTVTLKALYQRLAY